MQCKRVVIFWGVLFYSQILHTYGSGQFFVGLLKYSIPNNDICCTDADGDDTSNTCRCDLIFDIEIQGLNGSTDVLSKRLSDVSISPMVAESFLGVKASNPMTFQFTKWLGEVNITVKVYDQDNTSLDLIDQFDANLAYQGQGDFYFLRSLRGNQMNNESLLTFVYRYGCNPTNGPPCFTDCMDHDASEVCPMTSPRPQVPDVTFTGFIKCEEKDTNGTVISNNCTTDFITRPVMPSDTTSADIKTPSKPISIQMTTTYSSKTTPQKYHDSGATPTSGNVVVSAINASSNTVNASKNTTDSLLTTFKSSTMTGTNSVTKTDKQTSVSSTESTNRSQTIPTTYTNSDMSTSKTATTNPPIPTTADVMEYWPAIVGGVLGGLILLAAIGFLIYYKRQKKLRKRQEIYNVNPKILRNFEEYEENGTSGRADVPLETEQY